MKALLDFLYTGEMSVERGDTADLQLLIETLQINPNLITVDHAEDEKDDAAETSDEEDAESGKDTTGDKAKSSSKKRSVEEDANSDKEGEEVQSKKAKCSTD